MMAFPILSSLTVSLTRWGKSFSFMLEYLPIGTSIREANGKFSISSQKASLATLLRSRMRGSMQRRPRTGSANLSLTPWELLLSRCPKRGWIRIRSNYINKKRRRKSEVCGLFGGPCHPLNTLTFIFYLPHSPYFHHQGAVVLDLGCGSASSRF